MPTSPLDLPSAPSPSPLQSQHETCLPPDPWFLRSSEHDAQLLTLASQLRSRTPASDHSSPTALSMSPHASLRTRQQRSPAASQLQPNSSFSLCSPDLSGSTFPVDGSDKSSSFTSTSAGHLPVEPDRNKMCSLQEPSGALGIVKADESAATPPVAGLLSAQAAVGTGATKVSKRRSRATSKPPITVLSADTSNFREMVQKLTGIPSSGPPLQRSRYQLWTTPSGVSVLKPHPSRPSKGVHNLPTLDTSSAFLLLDGGSSLTSQGSPFLQADNFPQNSLNLPFLQSAEPLNDVSLPPNIVSELAMNRVASQLQQTAFNSDVPMDLKSLLTNHVNDLSKQCLPTDQKNSTPAFWDASQIRHWDRMTGRLFGDTLQESLGPVANPMDEISNVTQAIAELEHFNSRQSTSLENLLLGNDRLDVDLPGKTLHTVDSWFSCDGIHAAPKMELAHNA